MTCPHPARVQAYTAEALPEEQMEALRSHLTVCDGCRCLADAFARAEMEPAGPEAMNALWARLSAHVEAARPARRGFRRFLLPACALVPVAAAAVLAIYLTRPPAAPLVLQTPLPPAAPSMEFPVLARLEPPPLELPLEDVLVTRSAGTAGLGPGLTAAFQAYQKGDYSGAAQRFDVLERQGSERFEAFLYHGVSLLLTGRAAEAAPLLRKAAGLAGAGRREQAQWFLAVALLRENQVAAARGPLRAVCASGHERARDACGLLGQIAGPAR
jgi:hypothetical protein